MKKILLTIILGIFLLSLVSAVKCNELDIKPIFSEDSLDYDKVLYIRIIDPSPLKSRTDVFWKGYDSAKIILPEEIKLEGNNKIKLNPYAPLTDYHIQATASGNYEIEIKFSLFCKKKLELKLTEPIIESENPNPETIQEYKERNYGSNSKTIQTKEDNSLSGLNNQITNENNQDDEDQNNNQNGKIVTLNNNKNKETNKATNSNKGSSSSRGSSSSSSSSSSTNTITTTSTTTNQEQNEEIIKLSPSSSNSNSKSEKEDKDVQKLTTKSNQKEKFTTKIKEKLTINLNNLKKAFDFFKALFRF